MHWTEARCRRSSSDRLFRRDLRTSWQLGSVGKYAVIQRRLVTCVYREGDVNRGPICDTHGAECKPEKPGSLYFHRLLFAGKTSDTGSIFCCFGMSRSVG